MALSNIDIKYNSLISKVIESRIQTIGPDGMVPYSHNPLYMHFHKGHSKFTVEEYQGHQFLVLAKYVNMFGSIYNRVVGLPWPLDPNPTLSTLAPDFLASLLRQSDFKEACLSTQEIQFCNKWSHKRELDFFTQVSMVDYYNVVSDRWAKINRCKWRSKYQLNKFNPDDFCLLSAKDIPDILEVFDDWCLWKGNISRGPFLKFFKGISSGILGPNHLAMFGYRYEGRLVFCEIFTRNTAKYWRGEINILARKNLPKWVTSNVAAYVHYMSNKWMLDNGVEIYYVAGSRDVLDPEKNGVIRHKEIFEDNCITWYKSGLLV